MKKKRFWSDWLVDNLNRNVMLDHIKFVEKGIRPKDKDYERFKRIEKHLQTFDKYRNWKYKQRGKS